MTKLIISACSSTSFEHATVILGRAVILKQRVIGCGGSKGNSLVGYFAFDMLSVWSFSVLVSGF